MPEFRRGIAGMQSNNGSGGKQFPAFCPEIRWQNDREEKFILFLNTIDDIPTVELHTFIPVGTTKSGKTKYDQFISRRDPAIGESADDLSDRLGRKAVARALAVAVELEPKYKMVNGKRRPTGFEVKTETFTRKTEEGGTEDVEAPLVGLVVQSPYNFYGWLGSFSESTGTIEDTPFQIIRRGKDAKTTYDFMPFLDQEVDFTNLISLVGNVSYLRGEVDKLPSDDKEAALRIGEVMLEKRLSELTDKDRYTELVTPIQEIEDRFGGSGGQTRIEPKADAQAMVTPTNGTTNGSDKFEQLRKMHEGV